MPKRSREVTWLWESHVRDSGPSAVAGVGCPGGEAGVGVVEGGLEGEEGAWEWRVDGGVRRESGGGGGGEGGGAALCLIRPPPSPNRTQTQPPFCPTLSPRRRRLLESNQIALYSLDVLGEQDYSIKFSEQCPQAYSYAYDDKKKAHSLAPADLTTPFLF
ncbi:hypothetical protein ACLB2K_057275 [Fragaria x ananassa]